MRRFASRPMFAAAVLAVTAVVLASCSGGDSDSTDASASSSPAAQPSSTPPAPPTTSAAASSAPSASSPAGTGVALKVGLPNFPDALTDAQGRAVYTFSPDQGGKSACSGQCAVNWPPVATTGTPTIVGGDATKVGQLTRDDGTVQATYGGWPLYYFFLDKAPAQANGAGISAFGGQFLLINKDTKRVG